MIRGIYEIRNVLNGNVYIGSSKNTRRRINTHRYFLNKNNHHCSHLQRAWNKYGRDAFVFSIVQILDNSEDLEVAEQLWINKSLGKLYNGCKIAGNKSGFKHSEETKRKISNSNKGKTISEDIRRKLSVFNKGKNLSENTKKKISIALTGRKRNFSEEFIKMATERLKPYMTGWKKGKHHSAESIEKMKRSKIGHKQSEETKKKRAKALHKSILQYDKEMNFIREWDSVKEAGEFLNIRRCFISSVLTNVKKSAKGYIFKYKL